VPIVARQGAYCSVEELVAAVPHLALGTFDAVILEHVLAASREVELRFGRGFFPYQGMNAYRWPPFAVAYSWEVWTDDDILSVTNVAVAAGGLGAVPVALTNYYLEPQQSGPPYSRIEVDLSSTDVLQAGPTPQRSVQITGQWGYCATLAPAGLLTSGINASVTALTVSTPVTVNQGDVIVIDSEAIYVDHSPSLASGTAVVQRGVNGTTAASHLVNAPISRYRAPADIRRLVRGEAMSSFQEDQGSWARATGSTDVTLRAASTQLTQYWQRAEATYRRTRLAAV
jgi:hypothetical protein